MTITNATQFPRTFYCRHMQPGIAKYENETILVDSDGMKNLVASVGRKSIPVYINHQDVDLKNIKEEASGYVSDSFYNGLDGWAWFKFIAVDDKAHEAIKKGWSVSNAYLPTEWGPAGTKNNCPYNREVRGGEFTHLAIVPDPRYEGALIYTPEEFENYQETHRKNPAPFLNSKENKPMLKFKMFKNKKEEVTGSEVDLDTRIELENGKSLSIREMVEAVVENSKEEEKTVDVDGKKMSIAELVNAYSKTKKNDDKAETPGDMSDEDVEGDQDDEGDDEIGKDKKNKKMKKNKKEKKNKADDEDEEDCMSNDAEGDEEDEVAMKNKKTKKNSLGSEVDVDDKYFNELRNAHLNPKKSDRGPLVVLSVDQIERGKQRYGSGTK